MHARKLVRCVAILTTLQLLCLPVPLLAADKSSPMASDVTVRHAYVEAYLQSQPKSITELPPPLPEPEEPLSPLLERLEVAGPWLKLMGSTDAERQWVESPCSENNGVDSASALCGLRWRKINAFSDLSTSLDELSHGLKSRVVGKGLADNLELDLDSSPEIRFRWEFE